MRLQFLGATRTVTGSRFLVEEGQGIDLSLPLASAIQDPLRA